MAYSTRAEARAAMLRAFEDFKEPYRTGPNTFNIPYSDRKAFDDKWNAIVSQAGKKKTVSQAGKGMTASQAGKGMTTNEYEYQKAIDLANISAQSGERIATIGKESALGVAGIQKESALGVANIDKQIKEMQLESAENIQKLSNVNKLSLANIATNQSILAGLVNAFNF